MSGLRASDESVEELLKSLKLGTWFVEDMMSALAQLPPVEVEKCDQKTLFIHHGHFSKGFDLQDFFEGCRWRIWRPIVRQGSGVWSSGLLVTFEDCNMGMRKRDAARATILQSRVLSCIEKMGDLTEEKSAMENAEMELKYLWRKLHTDEEAPQKQWTEHRLSELLDTLTTIVGRTRSLATDILQELEGVKSLLEPDSLD